MFSFPNVCDEENVPGRKEKKTGENGNVSASDVYRSLDTEHLVFIKS